MESNSSNTANVLEIICPKCKANWHLKFSGMPVDQKVFCPTCDAYLDVLELFCTGNGRPYHEELPVITTLDSLIAYHERSTKNP